MLRKKTKKKKPLTLFTKQKLHSNSKSTYFYSKWLDSLEGRSDNLTNDFRWSSRHCEQSSSGLRLRDGANPTRSSRAMKSYSKIAHCGSSYILPVVCSMALLLVAGFAINPLTTGETFAIDEPNAQVDTANASIELSVGNNNLANTTAKAGQVNYVSTTVNVKATDVNGYKMYVQAAPGSSAVLSNGGVKVEGVGRNVATGDFGENKWGYALDATGAGVENLAYNSVPENGATLNPAYITDETTEEKNFNLAFAAKFASDAPAGHYGTNVLLSVAADAETVGGFYNIEYMQDMTTSICNQANENDTKQLIDKRDNKKYWVTKLRDGNCWMTQNLDLDIPAEGLTAALSDMDTDWNSSSKYKPVATRDNINGWKANNTSGATSENVVQSYDLGEVICNTTGCSAVDKDAINSHYLAGNLYSWNAATAGTGGGLTSIINADGSICPKQWGLPSNNSYGALFTSYGVYQTGSVYYGEQNMNGSPIYFVRAGRVYMRSINTVADNVPAYVDDGSRGYYWTKTSSSTLVAYSMDIGININSNTSTTYNYKFGGYSVRCVAR